MRRGRLGQRGRSLRRLLQVLGLHLRLGRLSLRLADAGLALQFGAALGLGLLGLLGLSSRPLDLGLPLGREGLCGRQHFRRRGLRLLGIADGVSPDRAASAQSVRGLRSGLAGHVDELVDLGELVSGGLALLLGVGGLAARRTVDGLLGQVADLLDEGLSVAHALPRVCQLVAVVQVRRRLHAARGALRQLLARPSPLAALAHLVPKLLHQLLDGALATGLLGLKGGEVALQQIAAGNGGGDVYQTAQHESVVHGLLGATLVGEVLEISLGGLEGLDGLLLGSLSPLGGVLAGLSRLQRLLQALQEPRLLVGEIHLQDLLHLADLAGLEKHARATQAVHVRVDVEGPQDGRDQHLLGLSREHGQRVRRQTGQRLA
eukprot:scaffold271_cov252-Pinguiococcus_pyrenoidosus.AAC.9